MLLNPWKPLLPAVFSMVLIAGSSRGLFAVTPQQAEMPKVAEQLLLSQANQDRVAHGLRPLERDPLLSQAAAFHAIEMARHGDISHGFPGEPELSERGSRAGVRFSLITENVAEAGDAGSIHELWMHSAGHRANLLDPEVNVVGVAVVVQQRAVYAVEDFASTVETMSLSEQESMVGEVLQTHGLAIAADSAASREDARQTCAMETGYAGRRQPWFIMRYTSTELSALPEVLKENISSGRYRQAVVGACNQAEPGSFAAYHVVVLLFP